MIKDLAGFDRIEFPALGYQPEDVSAISIVFTREQKDTILGRDHRPCMKSLRSSPQLEIYDPRGQLPDVLYITQGQQPESSP